MKQVFFCLPSGLEFPYASILSSVREQVSFLAPGVES